MIDWFKKWWEDLVEMYQFLNSTDEPESPTFD